MTKLTEEVKNIFTDRELKLHSVLRELASCFGPDATVHDVAVAFADFALPKKTINGTEYVAGYRGSDIVTTGNHEATLVELKQSGANCKLLFTIGNKFLYQTVDQFRVEDVVALAENRGKKHIVSVIHEIVANTGDVHAIVAVSKVA